MNEKGVGMKIGVPKEIKNNEFRVGLVPEGVRQLAHDGHEVLVETKAGLGIGVTDEEYKKAGATIYPNAEEIFKNGKLIIKVKEPQPQEKRRRAGVHTRGCLERSANDVVVFTKVVVLRTVATALANIKALIDQAVSVIVVAVTDLGKADIDPGVRDRRTAVAENLS